MRLGAGGITNANDGDSVKISISLPEKIAFIIRPPSSQAVCVCVYKKESRGVCVCVCVCVCNCVCVCVCVCLICRIIQKNIFWVKCSKNRKELENYQNVKSKHISPWF